MYGKYAFVYHAEKRDFFVGFCLILMEWFESKRLGMYVVLPKQSEYGIFTYIYTIYI